MAWRGRSTALKIGSIDEFRRYLGGLEGGWKPAGMTLHNTASPSRARWDAYPGETWLRNLKSYYEGLGWSAGPHAFVDGINIWIMTDFNVKGVHSPSFNGTRLGIEMVADFDTEDDDTGIGLKVKTMTAQLFAACHDHFGWEPNGTNIKLHKEDPATDHACPGKDISKDEFIRLVAQYMGDGGDEQPVGSNPNPPPWNILGVVQCPADDPLNLRESSSTGAQVIRTLPRGTKVLVFNEALNGATKWLNLQAYGDEGWASAKFIEYQGEATSVRLDNITATEFGGAGDEQTSAYPPHDYIDPNVLGVALPYKWRSGRLPAVTVTGPMGKATCKIVDVGPWNIDNPEYCLQGKRPMAEQQFIDKTPAQNGRVPTNDAGIDLTPAAARAVGIAGKGKVSVEIEIVDVAARAATAAPIVEAAEVPAEKKTVAKKKKAKKP